MSTPHERHAPAGTNRSPGRLAGPPNPILGVVAEIIHQGTADQADDLVALCSFDDDGIDLALWSIPPEVGHPTDVLVGWRPPEWATVVGLVTTGEARSADSIEAVQVTVATESSGQTATVLERSGRAPETLLDPPEGWGADALARCLALPTDPPKHGLHLCVEANWLRAVAAEVGHRGARGRDLSWEQVARLHPLRPPGPPAGPARLRRATAALDVESSWQRMVERTTPGLARPALHPPGGSTVPLDRWFDAGSFCRWSVRHLPEMDDLLFEVLEAVPAGISPMILDSLVSTTAWHR